MAEHHELAVFPGGMESKTEITLLTTMAKEGHKRRLASERKKEAERQLEAAKLRKAEQDAKTRLRHEEAARYTQQQRLWWDDEVIHQIAVSKNNYFLEEVDRIKEIGDHDKKIVKETKQIAKVEQLIREKQERFDAAVKERQKRAKEKEDDKFMKEKKSQRETAAESYRQIDYAVKSEMALQTKVQSAEEAKKQAERAARGETERKLTERQRQEWVDEKVRQKALDIVEEKKLFKMDETIRADYKAGRKALKQLRRKQGSDKMLQQMEESKMLEQMEREKMLADKKAFRAKTRAKSAEAVVLKEAAVRLEEERLAANALWDAQRQVEDMKLAKSREHAAHETLAQVTKTHKRDKLAPSRTGYEARMRKIFGTPGSSDEVDMGTNLMFITRAM